MLSELERAYVIWSDEHEMFWRPDSAGYTKSFKNAGRYSFDEVERIAKNCNPDKMICGLRVGVNYLDAALARAKEKNDAE